MSFAETVPATLSARDLLLTAKLAMAVTLAVLADWLFYDQIIGTVIFAIALIGAAAVANYARLDRSRIWLAGLVLFAGLVPAIEDANALSLAFAVVGLGFALSWPPALTSTVQNSSRWPPGICS